MRYSRRAFLKTTLSGTGLALAAPALIGRSAFGADEPIVIGGLHDQSGPIAATGTPMVDSLTLAIDQANAAGGLLGRPLKLVHYDTQSNIQLYSQFARQLALKDRVSVVFGGVTSASREAIRPTFNRYQVPYFYSTFYEGGVCDRNSFSLGTTPAQTVEKLVPFAMNKWGKKAYIIAADYNYGQITAKWMRKYVQDNGGETLAVDFFPLDVTNFGPTISKIQAAKPDIILSALVGGNHTSFYRQWTAAGMKKQIPIASTTFGIVNEQATLDDAESTGVVASYGYFEELDSPANNAFLSRLKEAFPDVPYVSEPGAVSYESFMLWAEAVRAVGSLDREKIIAALEEGLSFDGPTGKVIVDRATHHVTRNAYIAEVEDRKWAVRERYEQQKPLDTAGVCDLVKNPSENKQYVIDI